MINASNIKQITLGALRSTLEAHHFVGSTTEDLVFIEWRRFCSASYIMSSHKVSDFLLNESIKRLFLILKTPSLTLSYYTKINSKFLCFHISKSVFFDSMLKFLKNGWKKDVLLSLLVENRFICCHVCTDLNSSNKVSCCLRYQNGCITYSLAFSIATVWFN